MDVARLKYSIRARRDSGHGAEGPVEVGGGGAGTPQAGAAPVGPQRRCGDLGQMGFPDARCLGHHNELLDLPLRSGSGP